MEELIYIMNQLQDVFSMSGIQGFDLPQIAVVGTQSSGKSSVLEHLVGRSFLPRGVGVVTRCPLLLQLVNSSRGHRITEDYAIFQHKKQVFKDYELITKEIENQTELLSGGDRGICSTPICLKLYSKTLTNLTLIDLPGITKVPVGNQPQDIEHQTKELIHEYIDKPNCIILVVTPANADMATCEGLKIAKEVDPEGKRTLAVVTKLDLMDQGTDARAMLSGKVIPVKLGIVGVVNRSQKGILENKSMKQSLKDEAEFLRKNYKEIQSIHGTPYLTNTIKNILISHIHLCLPDLKYKVKETLNEQRLQLITLGHSVNNPTFLPDLLCKFSNLFCSKINGTKDNIDTKEMNEGAKISNIFNMANNTLDDIDPFTGMSKEEIGMALRNAYGINITCFIPKHAFENLVRKQIKLLLGPCLTCVDTIFKELFTLIKSCVNNPELHLEGYPKLQKMVSAVAIDLLECHCQTTKKMVNNIFDVHLAYINYDHIDFLPNGVKNNASSEESNNAKPTGRDIGFYEDIYTMAERYFNIVRRSVKDMLPKIIMCFMVNTTTQGLKSTLMSELHQGEHLDLLQESPEFFKKKNMVKESVMALEKADSILNSIKPSFKSVLNNM